MLQRFRKVRLSSGYSSGTNTLLHHAEEIQTYRIERMPKCRRKAKFLFTGKAPRYHNGSVRATAVESVFNNRKVGWRNELVVLRKVVLLVLLLICVRCAHRQHSEDSKLVRNSEQPKSAFHLAERKEKGIRHTPRSHVNHHHDMIRRRWDEFERKRGDGGEENGDCLGCILDSRQSRIR